jgi:hypothetical protein
MVWLGMQLPVWQSKPTQQGLPEVALQPLPPVMQVPGTPPGGWQVAVFGSQVSPLQQGRLAPDKLQLVSWLRQVGCEPKPQLPSMQLSPLQQSPVEMQAWVSPRQLAHTPLSHKRRPQQSECALQKLPPVQAQMPPEQVAPSQQGVPGPQEFPVLWHA